MLINQHSEGDKSAEILRPSQVESLSASSGLLGVFPGCRLTHGRAGTTGLFRPSIPSIWDERALEGNQLTVYDFFPSIRNYGTSASAALCRVVLRRRPARLSHPALRRESTLAARSRLDLRL